MKEKDITFEDELWKAADKLRKKVEVHEYRYVVLGLIFLRYLSYAFEEKRKEILEKQRATRRNLRCRLLRIGRFILLMGLYMFQRRQAGIT